MLKCWKQSMEARGCFRCHSSIKPSSMARPQERRARACRRARVARAPLAARCAVPDSVVPITGAKEGGRLARAPRAATKVWCDSRVPVRHVKRRAEADSSLKRCASFFLAFGQTCRKVLQTAAKQFTILAPGSKTVCDLGRDRTCNLQLRRLTRYPLRIVDASVRRRCNLQDHRKTFGGFGAYRSRCTVYEPATFKGPAI